MRHLYSAILAIVTTAVMFTIYAALDVPTEAALVGLYVMTIYHIGLIGAHGRKEQQ